LPSRFREGRQEGFVTLTIADIETPSEEERLEFVREAIAQGDRDIAEGHVSLAEDVFAPLRSALPR
jgi:hypothetical protein